MPAPLLTDVKERLGEAGANAVLQLNGVRISFSQNGEDCSILFCLDALGLTTQLGFYVDVGAFHPTVYSNTFLLRLMGWRGINIEPNPDALAVFGQIRGADINLHCAVAAQSGRRWLRLEDRDGELSPRNHLTDAAGSGRTIEVECRTLEEILAEHRPPDLPFGLLNIDAEGHDDEVLFSFDIDRHRPAVIAIESIEDEVAAYLASAQYGYLARHNYRLVSRHIHTSIFCRRGD